MDKSLIEPSQMIIRAFSRAKIEMVSDINVDLESGPYVFTIPFYILNIEPTYRMLLGRP